MEAQDTSPAAKLAAGNLLTDTEVAALCGCAVQTLRNMRWRGRGEGPAFVRLGGRMIRYKPADVQAFINGAPAKGAA
jgi:predicted DNA-binding transcriptional regulator AlpA